MLTHNESRHDFKVFSPESGFPPEQGLGNPGGRPESLPEGWNLPKPEFIPSPTYWPFVLSLGAALVGLGLLTSKIIAIPGFIFFVIAIVKWVGEIFHEQ